MQNYYTQRRVPVNQAKKKKKKNGGSAEVTHVIVNKD